MRSRGSLADFLEDGRDQQIASHVHSCHPRVRRILEAHADWEICAEADNGEKAVSLAEQLSPDLILMDVSMPIKSGLEATREISDRDPNIPVLVFTMHESNTILESARKMGARGVVLKSDAVRDLVVALECVLSGGTFFPPEKGG